MTMTTIDEGKLNALLGRAVNDLGAAMQAPLVVLGYRLVPSQVPSQRGTFV